MTAVMSEEELVAWGDRVGAGVATPVVFALRGELGAGKSTLARAIARGAGVVGPIPSPTFNLLLRYGTSRGVEVVHLDLYRLERKDEVWALGWTELGVKGELVLVEWPERAEDLLPVPRWEVWLRDDGDAARRSVEVVARGEPPPLPPLNGGVQ
ncbi:MAG: tRNA (adenosine(37)-N6)-threonylcarbamoyltransferase complex ATPase subunit type 1 TsaE [Gemmatimonadota bacterium]|nr:tRNA (adenosine(37)-N6)-threonylcarbamoyltransferase complex ATPase subunit type 1 TsaE [Gemmatimonadota bacterium]